MLKRYIGIPSLQTMFPYKPIKKQLKFIFFELLLVYLVVIILMVASCHRSARNLRPDNQGIMHLQ